MKAVVSTACSARLVHTRRWFRFCSSKYLPNASAYCTQSTQNTYTKQQQQASTALDCRHQFQVPLVQGIRPVKNRVVGCWCGCLSGARCRLAYGPADATALTVSCLSKIQIGFTFLVPVHPGGPGERVVKWVCVCVLVQQIWHNTHISAKKNWNLIYTNYFSDFEKKAENKTKKSFRFVLLTGLVSTSILGQDWSPKCKPIGLTEQ